MGTVKLPYLNILQYFFPALEKMSSSSVCETTEERPVIAKSDTEKNGRTKARKKKELKNMEQILKSVHNLDTEAKLQAVCEKYAELMEEQKETQSAVKTYERHLQVLQREKEHLQTENSKGILARSRLEELCRELQRQNKVVKEESMLRIKEEEERRKEVATKFQTTLSEVSSLLQQNNEKNNKLREENSEMAAKLQMLCDQYTLREQHLDKLGKQYDIERQLNEARLAKARMEAAEDKEKMLREKQNLLLELTEYQKKSQAQQQEEVALRQQLSMYTDKYDDFQKALTSSNRTFVGFKDQMDAMTKKLKKLEKETATWKSRWEKRNATLLDMATEKKRRDADLLAVTKQLAQLEKLCRALQTERTSLISQLKAKTQQPLSLAEESQLKEDFLIHQDQEASQDQNVPQDQQVLQDTPVSQLAQEQQDLQDSSDSQLAQDKEIPQEQEDLQVASDPQPLQQESITDVQDPVEVPLVTDIAPAIS